MHTHHPPAPSTRVPRSRARARRAPWRSILIVTVLAGALLGMGASVVHAGPSAVLDDTEAVTFQRIGTRSCTSVPDRVWLLLTVGDWLTVVNRTGLDATLQAGQERLGVPDGAGLAITLAAGVHSVRLIPACAGWTGAVPAFVGVRAPAPSPEVTPAGGHHPPSSPASTRPAPKPSPEPSAVAVPGRQPRGPGGAAGESAARPGRPTASLEDARQLAPHLPDGSRTRLLALVAAVCVLGVTAAIIRAIVAQRTSSPVRG